MLKGYLGTLLSDNGEGIFSFNFDNSTGKFNNIKQFSSIKNSKFLLTQDNFIFSLFKTSEGSGLVVFNLKGDLIDSLIFENSTSSQLIKIENLIYTVNETLGSISKLSFVNEKLNLIFTKIFGRHLGATQIIPFKNKFLLLCTSLDKILILDSNLEILDTIFLPKNSGPKRGLFSHNNKYFYLITQLEDMIYTYEIVDEDFYLIDIISSLPADQISIHGTTSISFNQDLTKLMVSIVSLNLIGIFDISNIFPKLITHLSTYGNYPVDFKVMPFDKFIICANRYTNSLTSISLKNGNKVDEVYIKGPITILK